MKTASTPASPSIRVSRMIGRPEPDAANVKPAFVRKPGPLTHVAFVLDESGSMDVARQAVIEGFNAQAKAVRDGARDAGHTTFTNVQFSNEVRIASLASAIATIPKLTEDNYCPSGGTALYDAVGQTVGALLATDGIDESDTATLVTIFTDGADNQSTLYSLATLKPLLEKLQETGRWTFALIAPKETANELALSMGIADSNVVGYDTGSVRDRERAFSRVAAASESYMTLRSAGVMASPSLYLDSDPDAAENTATSTTAAKP